MPRLPALALAVACATAVLPAHAIEDDRFVLRGGALHGQGETAIAGRTTYLGQPAQYSERFEGGNTTVPSLSAQVRLGDRHRLVFSHVRFDEDADATLDQAISYDNIVIPAGSSAHGEADLQITGAAYDFAVAETPTLSAGLQLGVQHVRISGHLRAVSGVNTYEESDEESGPLPVAGARLTLAPQPNWRVDLQAQHMDSDWVGLDDYEGSLTVAHALAEYRFGSRVGVHAGYQWLRFDLADAEGDEGVYAFEQRFDGPVVGVTLAF